MVIDHWIWNQNFYRSRSHYHHHNYYLKYLDLKDSKLKQKRRSGSAATKTVKLMLRGICYVTWHFLKGIQGSGLFKQSQNQETSVVSWTSSNQIIVQETNARRAVFPRAFFIFDNNNNPNELCTSKSAN